MNFTTVAFDQYFKKGVKVPPTHVMDMLIDVTDGGQPTFSVEAYLKQRQAKRVLDVATGVGYYSTRLIDAGFEVVSADIDADALKTARDYGSNSGHWLNTVQVDWRYLRRSVGDGYDAVLCLSNAFSHVFKAPERRRALSEFLSVLSYDGFLLLGHRNYDAILNGLPDSSPDFCYASREMRVTPVFADEGLVQLAYHLPEVETCYLNTYPIRKENARRLIQEVGFQKVKTFGIFKASNADLEPDYWLHAAEKSL